MKSHFLYYLYSSPKKKFETRLNLYFQEDNFRHFISQSFWHYYGFTYFERCKFQIPFHFHAVLQTRLPWSKLSNNKAASKILSSSLKLLSIKLTLLDILIEFFISNVNMNFLELHCLELSTRISQHKFCLRNIKCFFQCKIY